MRGLAVPAGLLLSLYCGACGADVALDCSPLPMACDSGQYRVDGAGCILECLPKKSGETMPICPAGVPMNCLFGTELDAKGCIKGCIEAPRGMLAGLCVIDGEPARCTAPAGQPARECLSDALVCGSDMRCAPRTKAICDPHAPMCPTGLVCRSADGCQPPVERCLGGYVGDPLGCVRGCRPPPMMMGAPQCAETPPMCPSNLYNFDDHGCITGCRTPPMTMPQPICGNLAERCAAGDSPVCRGCAFGYTLDERHCLDAMCLPDPGLHPCAPPPDRCDKGFAADALGCLSCRS